MTIIMVEGRAHSLSPHSGKDAVIANELFASLRLTMDNLHSTTASTALFTRGEFAA